MGWGGWGGKRYCLGWYPSSSLFLVSVTFGIGERAYVLHMENAFFVSGATQTTKHGFASSVFESKAGTCT